MATNTVPSSDAYDVAENVHIWKNAQVWISDDEKAQVESNGTFGDGWLHVGMLAGGSSIGQERDADRSDIEGWGAQLIATDQKFKKDTRKFTALEDTKTTFELMYPNSEYNEGGTTVIMAPVDALKVVAFKTTDQHGKTYIEVTRTKANVYPSSMDKNDDGASQTEFTVDVRKDSKGALYELHVFDEDTAAEALTRIRFKDDAGTTVNAGGSASYGFNLAGATGGTFDVTVDGHTASNQAYNVTAYSLEGALKTAGASTASVAGSAASGFTITGVTGQPSVDASKLTGGDFPTTVTVTKK